MNIEKEERANAKRIEQFTKDKDCLLLLSNKSHPTLSAWSYTDEESYYPFINEKYFFGKEVPYSPIESCHMMDSESNLQTDFDDQFVLRDKLELLGDDTRDWSKKPEVGILPCPNNNEANLWAQSSKFAQHSKGKFEIKVLQISHLFTIFWLPKGNECIQNITYSHLSRYCTAKGLVIGSPW